MNNFRININHNKIIALKQNIDSIKHILSISNDNGLIEYYSEELNSLEQLLKEWSLDYDYNGFIDEIW